MVSFFPYERKKKKKEDDKNAADREGVGGVHLVDGSINLLLYCRERKGERRKKRRERNERWRTTNGAGGAPCIITEASRRPLP